MSKIARIIRASNHFDCLQLPKPYADLMGEPVWDVTEEQVGKAFRRASLSCHPDKSTDPEAPRAFEVLKKAKACLLNELDRDDYLKAFVTDQKTLWEGSWAKAEDAFTSKQRVSSMRDEAQRSQNESVLESMQERHAQAARKARQRERAEEARARSKVRQLEEAEAAATSRLGGGDDDDDGDYDDDGRPVLNKGAGSSRGGPASKSGPAARKRPKFL